MRLSDAEFRRLAIDDPDGKWELFDGEPRRKPCMTWEHNYIALYLAASLIGRLDVREYHVRSEAGHVRRELATYHERGDQDIWLVHPYDRTTTIWRRQPDGTYAETTVKGGRVQPSSLPNVTIDFDALFEQAMQ